MGLSRLTQIDCTVPFVDDRVHSRLRGVAAGLLTPFDGDLETQHDKFEANAKSFPGDGILSFLAAANIGEYRSLSQQERIGVTETAVDALPDSACIPAGVGGLTKAVADLMETYGRVDVNAMMVMPPDHVHVHERGLIRYYEKLDTAIDMSLVPYVRGFDPPVSFLHDLSHIEGVVGVKYAIENPVKLGSAVAVTDNDMVWVDGLAELHAVSSWSEGIEGFSANVSNFRPEISFALFEMLTEENWERTYEIHDLTLPFQALRGEAGIDSDLPDAISVPVVKKGLELVGLHGGEVRELIWSLSADDECRAEKLYEEFDDDIARVID